MAGRCAILKELPRAVLLLFPELEHLPFGPEPLADCARCVLLPEHSGKDPDRPWSMNPDVRCCSYHPRMPNFLLGRALRRGGKGATRILERLEDRRGVTSWGIHAPKEWEERYEASIEGFGKDATLRCPYWAGGRHACSIWRDRNGICRTWYCRYARGMVGRDAWLALKSALEWAEKHLAMLCVALGDPPDVTSRPKGWAKWYAWCDKRLERITDAELAVLRSDAHARATEVLTWFGSREDNGIPEIVIPSVRDTWDYDGRVQLTGYSRFDVVDAPQSVFLFLSKLDGVRSWRRAMEETRAEAPEAPDEAMIAEMYRTGTVRAPRPGDLPGGTVGRFSREVERMDFLDGGIHFRFPVDAG